MAGVALAAFGAAGVGGVAGPGEGGRERVQLDGGFLLDPVRDHFPQLF
ncbi:hypothetical protein [Fodinicola acaciae]|nr:hypothetical protein [Fodinicola acaciae]